jgi:tRNA-splicing ligase RtcB
MGGRSWTGFLSAASSSRAGRCVSIAEEALGAYKDIAAVVEAAHRAGLSRKVTTLAALICIKG